MVFVALVAALLIEQARALPDSNTVYTLLRRYMRAVERTCDGGRYQQGAAAWMLVVGLPVLATYAVAALIGWAVGPAAVLFDIAVLYLTMGFRQFSHGYTETLEHLRAGELAEARVRMREWLRHPVESYSASEIARLAIERGLIEAHRHVFGVILWYAVFGAGGAVLYRLAAMLRDAWGRREQAEDSAFGRFSAEVYAWCDWVPVRLTAVSFAVVGDFEDAIYCWRSQAGAWDDPAEGIVLAAGAGAIGVRLGSMLGAAETVEVRPELGTGDEADAEIMTSAIGLIWRALVLWLFVVLLLTLAQWFG